MTIQREYSKGLWTYGSEAEFLPTLPRHRGNTLVFVDDVIVSKINDIFREKFVQVETLHDLRASDDGELYIVHYTGLDTLFSILRDFGRDSKGFLRMYDSFHLNDPEEGSFLTRPSELGIEESETTAAHAYVASVRDL